jgi:uncharacterized membrane protein
MTQNAPPNRVEAQRRADEIRVFRTELARLEDNGVLRLDEEQRRGVTSHHDALLAGFSQTFDVDTGAKARQLSLGMRIASFLGALALAASVFFLFYQFWGWFSTPVQVSILMAASVGSYLATFVVQRRDSTGYFTKLAAMVAFACFVLNIVMLGQIFNITPSDKAFLPWAALALLLAYSCDLRLLLAAGILCLTAFISARTATWSGIYWLHFGERPENFFPAAIAIFFVPQILKHARFPDFPAIYRVFGLLILFLPVLVLSNWGQSSYLHLDRTIVEGLYQTIGFTGTALAIWYGAKRQWNEVVNTSVVLFVIFLYTKLFDWWWDMMPKWLFFLVLGLVAVLLLVVFKRLRANVLNLGDGEARP